ncbi:hypothetical protein [Mycolicibacterium sp. CBMA 234]|uniref:hypothetical protein n=1 Tax=Mycolicibacterium sp. CBMA 234 TaxID=1918495 RepID=UPI0012DD381E|nr:hypothetical protein [Mycolicibacterium sp. CBMA 234]
MSVAIRPLSVIPSPAPGVAALSATCLVLASAAIPAAATHPLTIASAAPPSPTVSLTALPFPLDLINQQVVFNTGLFVDWITTGAALFQRQTQVPGSFVAAIGSGTPPLTAAAQALSTVADIEFEAGHDLIGFAQDFADFQLQFRATTLSLFPPFNAGPGQQFVVATTTFGLNLVQGIADFANALVTAVQQLTHGALGTPLPVAPLKISAVAATSIPVITPKTLLGQQQSTVNTFSSTLPNVGKPMSQHPLGAVTNTVTSTVINPPKGHGFQTLSFQPQQSNGNGHQGNDHQSQNHQSPNKGPHHH